MTSSSRHLPRAKLPLNPFHRQTSCCDLSTKLKQTCSLHSCQCATQVSSQKYRWKTWFVLHHSDSNRLILTLKTYIWVVAFNSGTVASCAPSYRPYNNPLLQGDIREVVEDFDDHPELWHYLLANGQRDISLAEPIYSFTFCKVKVNSPNTY